MLLKEALAEVGRIYRPYSQNSGHEAQDTLLARYDRGEITREQYNLMMHDLKPKGGRRLILT
jgi:uncharacterized membrane protein